MIVRPAATGGQAPDSSSRSRNIHRKPCLVRLRGVSTKRRLSAVNSTRCMVIQKTNCPIRNNYRPRRNKASISRIDSCRCGWSAVVALVGAVGGLHLAQQGIHLFQREPLAGAYRHGRPWWWQLLRAALAHRWHRAASARPAPAGQLTGSAAASAVKPSVPPASAVERGDLFELPGMLYIVSRETRMACNTVGIIRSVHREVDRR